MTIETLGPRIPVTRRSAYPRSANPPLRWLTRADPMTKLALAIAFAASIFCVCAAVAMAVGKATL